MMVRRLTVGFAVCLSVALVAGAGFYLADTVAASREKVFTDFGLRPAESATTIAAMLGASDGKTRAAAASSFSGSPALLRRQAEDQLQQLGTAWYAVLGDDGAELFTYPDAHASTANLRSSSGLRIAQQTAQLAFGDVISEPTGGVVPAFQPFNAPDGPRILVAPVSLSELSVLVSSAISSPGGSSYLIDGRGIIVSGSAMLTSGSARSDLFSAARQTAQGVVGDTYFSSSSVAGTDWRVIMATSQSTLLRPVQSTGRVAWQLFGALGVAMIVILVIGAAALRSSARLARARQHDALTGLPNRALFLERAETAILDWRRRRQDRSAGALAALFLDLDGFKPVNDTYGHSTGDALLQQVALRLFDATRPDDYVSRFGGDEFVVLCRGLRTHDDALAVADRIRTYLADPFVIGDHTVTIGVSIGIALLDDHGGQDAAALLHNADLALYEAKAGGRDRVKVFTPEMADQAH